MIIIRNRQKMLPKKYSFHLVSKDFLKKSFSPKSESNFSVAKEDEKNSVDNHKRLFLKLAGITGLGLVAGAILPKKADAYIMGSTPTSNVVGVKNVSNVRINPAQVEGQGISKLSISLSGTNTVRTPASGKSIRVYASRFSLTANANSVSFRFATGAYTNGTDHEVYLSPKTGGLYGANNHPNYIQGLPDQVLYCVISGTTTVQINIDYSEV